MTLTIGILTGGGDVPGLNPCIKSVVMGALELGYRVIGIRRGWAGLLHYNPDEPSTRDYYIRELHAEDVRTIDRTGGTVLHTSRTNPQRVSPKDTPDFLKNSKWGKPIPEEGKTDYTDYVLNVLANLGIDVLVRSVGMIRSLLRCDCIAKAFPLWRFPRPWITMFLGRIIASVFLRR